MHLACFEPEIPQNVGTLIRASACLGFHLHLIAPLGFLMSNRHLKRAHMDYVHKTNVMIHKDWETFLKFAQTPHPLHQRLIGLTSKGPVNYTDVTYNAHDILLVGSENSGFGQIQENACHTTVRIPMQNGTRSLNMAIAACMVMGEALRQGHLFP